MYLLLTFTLSILVSNLHGYPTGAPAGACDTMTPSHDGNAAQSGASSYTITPSATTYGCGDNITVTLAGANFRGFLCQARQDVNTYATVGTLTNTDGSVTTTNNCAGKASLTHTENSDKSLFQFSWTHDGTSTDTFYIVCTVVQVKATFWVKESSVAISYTGTASACSGAGRLTIPLLLMCASIVFHQIAKIFNQ